jgi:hypothetical protein
MRRMKKGHTLTRGLAQAWGRRVTDSPASRAQGIERAHNKNAFYRTLLPASLGFKTRLQVSNVRILLADEADERVSS